MAFIRCKKKPLGLLIPLHMKQDLLLSRLHREASFTLHRIQGGKKQ